MKLIICELIAAACITGTVYFGCKHDWIGLFFWSSASLVWFRNAMEAE